MHWIRILLTTTGIVFMAVSATLGQSTPDEHFPRVSAPAGETLMPAQHMLVVGVLLCSCPGIAQPNYRLMNNFQPQNPRSDTKQSVTKSTPWPIQLELRVPFEPTAFPSGQHIYLMYELHLTNFGTAPLSVSRIEVRNADGAPAQPIVAFEAQQLETILQPLGGKTLSDPKGRLLIGDGQTTIAFMSIAFERGSHIPDRLLHSVITADSVATGAIITTHHTPLHVLGPPVEGANWLAWPE